jgi:hypothetical protein
MTTSSLYNFLERDIIPENKPVYQNLLLLLTACLPHPIQGILFSSVKTYCSFPNDQLICKPDNNI